MSDRPKIGLALSGGSGKALAHAGVLDVFEEEGIPIDYIAGCSSGAIIAAAYACGTLRDLKREAAILTKKELFNLFGTSENMSGFLSLQKSRDRLGKYIKGNFEDVRPHLAFVSVDIETGDQVAISMGEMMNAIIASCTLPGLFETVKWGNRNLVDGGLLNIVPADVVRSMGADIVISVDIAASKYIFSENTLRIIQWLIWLIKASGLPYTLVKKLINDVRSLLISGNFIQIYSQSDFLDESEKMPNILHVMTQIIQISKGREKKTIPFEKLSDIIIMPKVKHFGRTEFSLMRKSYLEGRRAAKAAIPHVLKLLEDIKTGRRAPLILKDQLATFVTETK